MFNNTNNRPLADKAGVAMTIERDRLLAELTPMIIAYARRYVRYVSRMDVDDLVQIAYISVMEEYPRLDTSIRNPAAYLMRIAQFAIKEAVMERDDLIFTPREKRAEWRRFETSLDRQLVDDDPDSQLYDLLAAPGPQDDCEHHQPTPREQALHEAVARLSPRHQRLLCTRYGLDMEPRASSRSLKQITSAKEGRYGVEARTRLRRDPVLREAVGA